MDVVAGGTVTVAVSTACELNIVVLAPGIPIYLGSPPDIVLNLISTTPDGVT